jgi:hypothetical protein
MKRKGAGNGQYSVKRRKVDSKQLGKRQMSAVKKVVKSELKKDTELKYFRYLHSPTFAPGAYSTYNLFYHGVSRGTDNNQCLGDKLRWKGIAIKYNIINGIYGTGSYVPSNQPIILDFYVLRAPEYYATVNMPLSALHNDTTANASLWFLKSQIKVLTKKTVKLTVNDVSNALTSKNGRIWIRRDQTIEFQDLSVDHNLKNKLNYYLVVINRSMAGSSIEMSFAWQNYFVDA